MATTASDAYARRVKELHSQVRKMRGWIASDPSQAEPLVDALNDLTAQRLLAHQWLESFADAQDALAQASKLVAFHGSVGPFTPLDDGARFFTATTHVALAQAGGGQPAGAAQTVAALRAWRAMLPHLDLPPALLPRTAVWLLLASSLGALATGDVGAANAFADAALLRAREGRLGEGEDAAALVDAALAVSDARWVAGVAPDAVAAARVAADAARRMATPVLESANRVSEAWATRVLGPLSAASGALADRLAATGDVEGALAERAALATVLRGSVGRLGDPARDALARVLTDQARDLRAVGRDDEALEAAGEAAALAGELTASEAAAGQRLDVQLLAVSELALVLLSRGEADGASEALASLFDRFASLKRPAGHEAALAVALLARANVEAALGDQQASEHTSEEFHALVRGLLAATPAGRTLWGATPGEEVARDRARGRWSRSPLPTPYWENLSDDDALAGATREAPTPEPDPLWAAPEPVAEPEPEPTWIEPEPQPEPVAEPEPVAQAEPEPQPEPITEPEPEPTWIEPEPQPEPVPEPEPVAQADLGLATHPAEAPGGRVEPASAAAILVATAEHDYRTARAANDRRRALATATVWVERVRPLFETDRLQWGPQLVEALRALGDARFRAGDWWGSRQPNKEAKQLTKELGL